jgi:hypothetical protein
MSKSMSNRSIEQNIMKWDSDNDTDQHTTPSSPDTVLSFNFFSAAPSIWSLSKSETPDARSASALRKYPTAVSIEPHQSILIDGASQQLVVSVGSPRSSPTTPACVEKLPGYEPIIVPPEPPPAASQYIYPTAQHSPFVSLPAPWSIPPLAPRAAFEASFEAASCPLPNWFEPRSTVPIELVPVPAQPYALMPTQTMPSQACYPLVLGACARCDVEDEVEDVPYLDGPEGDLERAIEPGAKLDGMRELYPVRELDARGATRALSPLDHTIDQIIASTMNQKTKMCDSVMLDGGHVWNTVGRFAGRWTPLCHDMIVEQMPCGPSVRNKMQTGWYEGRQSRCRYAHSAAELVHERHRAYSEIRELLKHHIKDDAFFNMERRAREKYEQLRKLDLYQIRAELASVVGTKRSSHHARIARTLKLKQ